MSFFRNITLRIKLLGIYLFGLMLIGVVGYSFFIVLEFKSYQDYKSTFFQQAKFYERKSFNHMLYTYELQNILKKLYFGTSLEKVDKKDFVNDFISNVALLSDTNYNFALFDSKGRFLSSNGTLFESLIKDSDINQAKVKELIKEAYTGGIHGGYVDLVTANGTIGYFVNVFYFEPLNYFLFSLENTDKTLENINTLLSEKRTRIYKAIFFSVLIGFTASVIVLAILFFYLRSITRSIDNITLNIQALSTSKVANVSLIPKNLDEIGRMISAFNAYMKKKVNLEKFKKLIEEDEGIEDVYCRVFTLLQSFGIDRLALYEIDMNKNKIEYISADNCSGFCTIGEMPCSADILVNADSCRSKRLAQVVEGDPSYRVCPKFEGYDKDHRHICIPVIIAGTAGQIVHISMTEEEEKKIKPMLGVIREYLSNAAPVIESKKLLENLRETTLRDPLTGLSNRRFLEEYTEVLIAETQRKQSNMGIMMCDLDYFKKVNDVYGHEAGDKVLQMLSQLIKQSVRASDIVIRYGGEEFLIIVKDVTDEEHLVTLGEKIRANVEAHKMNVSNSISLKKTVSIGISMFPFDTENFWQSIKFADVAMYQAKEKGRNKVLRFTKDMWKELDNY